MILTRERMSPVATIATGGTVLAGALLLAAAFQNVATILAASVLIGIGYSFMHSSLQTWATEVAPEARGTAVVLFVTAVYGGASIAHAAVARARFRVEPEFSVAAEATARSEGRR